MKWKMESSIAFSGLYDVYDKDGNRVAEHKILEEALLIANAPDLLKGIMRAEQTVRNLAANLEGDLAQIARNEATNLRDDRDRAIGVME